jgi:quercetin dioxygenase-like cupin family protein
MKRTSWAVLLFCLVPAVPAVAQDPVATNGDKYKLVFENERVRVLDYRDKPGQKTTPHQHPDALVYALAPFKRRLIFGDGKTVTVEKKEGEVYFVKAQKHTGENIGTTDTHVLIVELKEPPR